MVLNSRNFALISCTAAAARPAVSLLCSLVLHAALHVPTAQVEFGTPAAFRSGKALLQC